MSGDVKVTQAHRLRALELVYHTTADRLSGEAHRWAETGLAKGAQFTASARVALELAATEARVRADIAAELDDSLRNKSASLSSLGWSVRSLVERLKGSGNV
jgi:hypothetical protein